MAKLQLCMDAAEADSLFASILKERSAGEVSISSSGKRGVFNGKVHLIVRPWELPTKLAQAFMQVLWKGFDQNFNIPLGMEENFARLLFLQEDEKNGEVWVPVSAAGDVAGAFSLKFFHTSFGPCQNEDWRAWNSGGLGRGGYCVQYNWVRFLESAYTGCGIGPKIANIIDLRYGPDVIAGFSQSMFAIESLFGLVANPERDFIPRRSNLTHPSLCGTQDFFAAHKKLAEICTSFDPGDSVARGYYAAVFGPQNAVMNKLSTELPPQNPIALFFRDAGVDVEAGDAVHYAAHVGSN